MVVVKGRKRQTYIHGRGETGGQAAKPGSTLFGVSTWRGGGGGVVSHWLGRTTRRDGNSGSGIHRRKAWRGDHYQCIVFSLWRGENSHHSCCVTGGGVNMVVRQAGGKLSQAYGYQKRKVKKAEGHPQAGRKEKARQAAMVAGNGETMALFRQHGMAQLQPAPYLVERHFPSGGP